MKSLSPTLRAHLALPVTTLCTCWKVTRQDGTVFAFTDHVADLEISGITYSASSGYTASAIQTAAALNVDNLEVQGAFSDESITEVDLLAGLWDFAEFEIFLVNYADLSQGTMKLRRGQLGEVRTGRGVFVAELRGMMQKLQQKIGRIVGPGCNADLGDARCGKDLATITTGGTITSALSNRSFIDSALAGLVADGGYAGGLLTFTSGDNVGRAMEVKQYAGASGTFLLHLSMPFNVQNGDTFLVHLGCDKALATCRDKFANVVNFRGFPHLPGLEEWLTGFRG